MSFSVSHCNWLFRKIRPCSARWQVQHRLILILSSEKLTLFRIVNLPIGFFVFTATGKLRATMATQELVNAKVKHKCASAPKSRNGCITWYVCQNPCTLRVQWPIRLQQVRGVTPFSESTTYAYRTRHLKCDEAKPICNRCSEDKVKCDGYSMPKPKLPRRKHRKKFAPSIVDTLSLCLTIDDIPSLSTSERLYFQHFLQFTTTQLSLSSGPTNFWLRYALPMGYQFESIRYSMIAVGASHRLFMAKSLGHSDIDDLK